MFIIFCLVLPLSAAKSNIVVEKICGIFLLCLSLYGAFSNLLTLHERHKYDGYYVAGDNYYYRHANDYFLYDRY